MKVGVLGGTFDPIHLGHLAAAEAAQTTLSLDCITLIPSHIPPHRGAPTTASGDQRLAMAQLAAANRPGWSVSRIELDRDGPSYTYDTLGSINEALPFRPAQGHPERSSGMSDAAREAIGRVEAWQIFFITGADAFAEIATWSRYPAVLDLANFVVVSRPGITLDSLRARVPSAFNRPASAATRVILVESHTPDVSSTEIRRRVRAGESLSGLVPDSVADYIRTHRLYLGS